MANTVSLSADALATRPGPASVVACARCGAPLATMAVSCQSFGTTVTGGTAAEHAERVRQRLQEAVGDRFELLELLGRGGMGIVFRAREAALDREVALKVLALDPILAPDAWARFEREAKLAARLDHPNVVPIFSVGQGASVAYYTMRLVRGGNVEDLLAGGRQLDLTQASTILRDVAAALDYAHRLGVVHRDIKPANILLGEGDHASVADFGIAKALGPAEGTTATGTGVIGSPGYMSPEQWRGDALDGRADQYALGIVAFEMLAGRRPFETVRVQDLLKLHLTGEVPDVSALRPGLDPAVGAAVQRALAKYPSERFPTASAFVETLAGRRPVTAARPTRTTQLAAESSASSAVSRGGGALAALLATLLIIGAGIGAAALIPASRPTVLGSWSALRARVAERLAGATPAVPNVPAPVGSHESTAVAPEGTQSVDGGGAAHDAVAEASVSAADSTPAPVRERAPIGLDPAMVGAAAAMTTGVGARHPLSADDGRGYLRVTTRGGSARVRVDGERYGFTPLVLRLEAGRHVVTVEGAGDAFLPLQLTVDVPSADTAAAVFTAPSFSQPRPAAPPDSTEPPQ